MRVVGKVHGGLARAGKVKGQTPKVAKDTEKKKEKKGRAKKRILYNRRFVNAVVGPGGRRKGPNQQQHEDREKKEKEDKDKKK